MRDMEPLTIYKSLERIACISAPPFLLRKIEINDKALE